MSSNNKLNNNFKVLVFGVASTPRIVVRGGMLWIRIGIGRRQNGLAWNFSGKPTFWERPFKGRLGGGYRPQADFDGYYLCLHDSNVRTGSWKLEK
jgi:hypothetical protein